jgi:hypothetical protein
LTKKPENRQPLRFILSRRTNEHAAISKTATSKTRDHDMSTKNTHLHTANQQLVSFLNKTDKETFLLVARVLTTATHPRFRATINKLHHDKGVPQADTPERLALSRKVASHLRYMGSHDLMCGLRLLTGKEAQANYMDVIRDCARQLNRRIKLHKFTLPAAGSLEQYEEIIVGELLQISFAGKSTEEIATILEDAGLEHKAAVNLALDLTKLGVPGVGIAALCKALGKKQITDIVILALQNILARIIGKEAAAKLLEELLKKVPQNTVKLWLRMLGNGLMAIDAIHFVCSPARRVVIPSVALISVLRYQERELRAA